MIQILMVALGLMAGCKTIVVPDPLGTRAYGGTCPPPTAIAEKVRERQALLAEDPPVVRPYPKPPHEIVSKPIKRVKRVKRVHSVCGSKRPVWYTNKYGRRKYRCR